MTWTNWMSAAAAAAFLALVAPAHAHARGADDLTPQLPKPQRPEKPGLV